MASIQVRRAYEEPQRSDGCRILVDRLWPRGLSKQAAQLDLWLKEIAPSTELRKWYGHDPAKFAAFSARYREELREPVRQGALTEVRKLAHRRPVTLLTATKDVAHSEATVLADLLRGET
jgi:uncharacterized protein YeaO (DUF488 family)